MKKLAIVLIVIGVLLAIAIGVGIWLDGKVKTLAEAEAEKRVVAALPRMKSATVEIDGFPFVADVLLFSTIDRLRVELIEIEGMGVSIESVVLVVDKIEIDRDRLLDAQQLIVTDIERAEVTAKLTGAAISKALRGQVELDGDVVRVTSHGHTAAASFAVEGRMVEVSISTAGLPPEVAAFAAAPLRFKLPPESVLPCTPSLRVASSRLELGCSVTELPAAVKQAIGQR